ncbi:olfactory receptor 13H1 [Alligator mississippiensis]|uniref:Olfactory receptor n=1 Tax=Alligator mississippiensis TaxID=8496 RepID=A0A151PHD4_ALLMI|nr:olfactory receptor 13H1 [Alligator mississippiensis]KYO48511.1 olfactory receptor 13H1-like [Alligator mississippiensis]
MGGNNDSIVTEFILLGLSQSPPVKITLFVLFLIIYLVTVVGNGLLILLTRVDSQLHTPMYFFLSNLSFIDICYTTSTVPQMLIHCLSKKLSISLTRCFTQMYISLFLGMSECLLLAVMAYDRWVAICKPLLYTLIMNKRVCSCLAAITWSTAFLLTTVPSLTMQAHLCGSNVVNHFVCEIQAMLKPACSDTHNNQIMMFATSILTLLMPFAFILITYTHIGVAVLRIRSASGRIKAFSTCASHLTVVVIFYGTDIFMYLGPQSKSSSDQGKVIGVFYGIVTPLLNPLICSLRNKDVKGALRKLAGRKSYT